MLAVCSFSSSPLAVLRGTIDGIGPVLPEEERHIYLLTLELDMVDSECGATFSIVDGCSHPPTFPKKKCCLLLIHSFWWIFGLVFSHHSMCFDFFRQVASNSHDIAVLASLPPSRFLTSTLLSALGLVRLPTQVIRPRR